MTIHRPRSHRIHVAASALALALAGGSASALAQQADTRAAARSAPAPSSDEQRDLSDAVQVIQQMKSDTRLRDLLPVAKGVFILPDYGRAGFVVGGQGGEGVLVTRHSDGWSNPVFYKMGGVSIGAQAGASVGSLAILLMTDQAVEQFRSQRKFSLNADAGLTLGRYDRRMQSSAGKVQDMLLWSNTRGAYAGVSVGATEVVVDDDANRAYYGREAVSPARILGGEVPNPQNNVLDLVLGA